MEAQPNLLADLFQTTERYGKSSYELAKLKALDKTADITSSLGSRFLFVLALSFFILVTSFALALWLGDLLGKAYLGFMIVAGFYAVVTLLLFFLQPVIKKSISNSVIRKMFK